MLSAPRGPSCSCGQPGARSGGSSWKCDREPRRRMRAAYRQLSPEWKRPLVSFLLHVSAWVLKAVEFVQCSVFPQGSAGPKARVGNLWECFQDATMLRGSCWYLVGWPHKCEGSHNEDSAAPENFFSCVLHFQISLSIFIWVKHLFIIIWAQEQNLLHISKLFLFSFSIQWIF